mgnify:CR=1 FL=1
MGYNKTIERRWHVGGQNKRANQAGGTTWKAHD